MKTVTLILCLLVSASTFAEIYKWTDEKGQVHYGENPGGKASGTRIIPQHYKPPSRPAPDAKQRMENIRKWTDARQKERQNEKRKKAKQQEKRAKQEEKCRRSRNRLIDLERGGRRYRLDANGQREFLSDQEIDANKSKTREYLDRNCR